MPSRRSLSFFRNQFSDFLFFFPVLDCLLRCSSCILINSSCILATFHKTHFVFTSKYILKLSVLLYHQQLTFRRKGTPATQRPLPAIKRAGSHSIFWQTSRRNASLVNRTWIHKWEKKNENKETAKSVNFRLIVSRPSISRCLVF